MNISYNWLKEYVNFDLTPEETAAALTSIGLETGSVEEVQSIKGGLEGLVIGKVLTCEPHPNSDHMHITTVDLGQGEPVQIVCGAANVAAGQKVVVATLGTKLYDGDECFTIKKSKLRGVESNGMICAEDEIGVVCGRFEGIDERVLEAYDIEEISIGDYVLTVGEQAAQVMFDAIIRLLPGVLGNALSAESESFENGLLEYPQYTRPVEWQGRRVPEVLLGGHHRKIADWRKEQALRITAERRPDLLKKYLDSKRV